MRYIATDLYTLCTTASAKLINKNSDFILFCLCIVSVNKVANYTLVNSVETAKISVKKVTHLSIRLSCVAINFLITHSHGSARVF